MRTRSLVPVAALGSAALVLVAVAPASAAGTTSYWANPGNSNWSTATWTPAAPGDADYVVFSSLGGLLSTYDLSGVTLAGIEFRTDHQVMNGGQAISVKSGIAVDAGVNAWIDVDVHTVANAQAIRVHDGGSFTLTGELDVESGSQLTLQADAGATIELVGKLDAFGTQCVYKLGAGTLRFSSNSGGGMGTCSTGEGLVLQEGTIDIGANALLGGTSFMVTGGEFTGGAGTLPSVVKQLNMQGGGVVSPGLPDTPIGTLHLWGTSAWTGGTYIVDVDPVALQADRVEVVNQAISIDGTVLAPRIAPGTPQQQNLLAFPVLSSDISVNGSFVSPAGDRLSDGDEFASNGQLWRYGQEENRVILTWLGAAPEPEPETPTMPTPPAKIDTAAPSIARIWR